MSHELGVSCTDCCINELICRCISLSVFVSFSCSSFLLHNYRFFSPSCQRTTSCNGMDMRRLRCLFYYKQLRLVTCSIIHSFISPALSFLRFSYSSYICCCFSTCLCAWRHAFVMEGNICLAVSLLSYISWLFLHGSIYFWCALHIRCSLICSPFVSVFLFCSLILLFHFPSFLLFFWFCVRFTYLFFSLSFFSYFYTFIHSLYISSLSTAYLSFYSLPVLPSFSSSLPSPNLPSFFPIFILCFLLFFSSPYSLLASSSVFSCFPCSLLALPFSSSSLFSSSLNTNSSRAT